MILVLELELEVVWVPLAIVAISTEGSYPSLESRLVERRDDIRREQSTAATLQDKRRQSMDQERRKRKPL